MEGVQRTPLASRVKFSCPGDASLLSSQKCPACFKQSVHCNPHQQSHRGEGCAKEQNLLCLKAHGLQSWAFGLLIAAALESEKTRKSHKEGLGCWSCYLVMFLGSFAAACPARMPSAVKVQIKKSK